MYTDITNILSIGRARLHDCSDAIARRVFTNVLHENHTLVTSSRKCGLRNGIFGTSTKQPFSLVSHTAPNVSLRWPSSKFSFSQ